MPHSKVKTADAMTLPAPIPAMTFRENLLPPRNKTRKPVNGNAGISANKGIFIV
jgi:hypothetical protein